MIIPVLFLVKLAGQDNRKFNALGFFTNITGANYQMDIQIQRTAKALDQCDCARLGYRFCVACLWVR